MYPNDTGSVTPGVLSLGLKMTIGCRGMLLIWASVKNKILIKITIKLPNALLLY